MLVLSRRLGEVIRIGDDIVVALVSCGYDRAVLRADIPLSERFVDVDADKVKVVFDGGKKVKRLETELDVDDGFGIGECIDVILTEAEDDRVKIGIEAPRDVPVHRQEVYRKIKQSGRRRQSNTDDRPTLVPDLSAQILPATELAARYAKWCESSNWLTTPEFHVWVWMATKNRSPDGSVVAPGSEGHVTLETFTREFGQSLNGIGN